MELPAKAHQCLGYLPARVADPYSSPLQIAPLSIFPTIYLRVAPCTQEGFFRFTNLYSYSAFEQTSIGDMATVVLGLGHLIPSAPGKTQAACVRNRASITKLLPDSFDPAPERTYMQSNNEGRLAGGDP